MKTKLIYQKAVCLIFFLITSVITANISTCQSEELPDKFIGIFVPITPSNGQSEISYVNNIVLKAKSYKIYVINLIVDWSNLEKEENIFQFENLHKIITLIQNQGCYVILRIYANASDHHKAWPGWLQQNLIDYYTYNNIINPLPWDAAYENIFHNFLVHFNNWFVKKNQSFPDAIQIAAGGSYGEQVLHGYDNLEYYNQYGGDYLKFRLALWGAEKRHVAYFVNDLKGIDADLSLMVNSLLPNDKEKNASVGSYAKLLGVKWTQTNAGICNLKYRKDGQENIDLLKYIDSPIILEDESSGGGACANVGHPADKPISERLKRIIELEQANDIEFNGIIINKNDLIESNRQGITQMLRRGGGVRPQTAIFTSAAAFDGWILESGESTSKGGSVNNTAAAIALGDDTSNRQYRSILHFDTASLPDNAVISKAKIGLRQLVFTGTNPLKTHRGLLTDIKSSSFSSSSILQAIDFQAAANANNVGVLFNDEEINKHIIELNVSSLPFINRKGVTQFRIRFALDDDNDHVSDKIMFFSGNSTNISNRPVLAVQYTNP